MTAPRIDLDALTDEEFMRLPLVIAGESKEVRYLGDGYVVVRYLPTIYSFTSNRCAVVPGSDEIRLRSMGAFLKVLRDAGIGHTYERVGRRFALSRLVMPHPVECAKYGVAPFVPHDLSEADARRLPVATPIEVIVKRFHEGTSKHRYVGMSGAQVRASHPLYGGHRMAAGAPYPKTVVRFDWRNPLGVCVMCSAPRRPDPATACRTCGSPPSTSAVRRVADEVLPEDSSELFIDVPEATRTARHIFAALQDHLGARGVVIYDLCLFIAEDGRTVYGEIGPDCGRFRHVDLGELDKDVWRAGGSSEAVLAKWRTLAEMTEGPPSKGYPRFALADLYDLGGQAEEFTVGTTNASKVSEIAEIFEPTGAKLHPYGENEPDETGSTFAENARIKARAYAAATSRVTIAEDSGLVVYALGGLPGVHSARFDDCDIELPREGQEVRRVLAHLPSGRGRTEMDAANNKRVLYLMAHVPQPYRAARFEVAFAVAAPDGEILFEASGTAHGWIANAEDGANGFGYDPIFIGNESGGVTWGRLDAARKNLRSHRARALAELAVWYAKRLRARRPAAVKVVVDGNDGTGKSTLCEALRLAGYDASDRGAPTRMTDDPKEEPVPGEVYLILDAPVEVSQERLAMAGKDLNERYHNVLDLTHYRRRFREVAAGLSSSFLIDASGDAASVLAQALRCLRGLEAPGPVDATTAAR